MALSDYLEKIIDSIFRYIPRRQPGIINFEKTRIIAHRGAYNNAMQVIENTQEAFEKALTLGCWGIELDVHETTDNILVVNHDDTLHRLWNKPYKIGDLSFKALRKLVPQILSLEEVVHRYGKRLHLFIEIKHPLSNNEELSRVLQPLTAIQDYHLLGLTPEILDALTTFPLESLMLVPVHNNVGKFCQLSLERQYGGVLGHYFLLTNARKQMLIAAKQSVGVGFVNSRFSLYRELTRGHQWLFTNAAQEIIVCMEKLKRN